MFKNKIFSEFNHPHLYHTAILLTAGIMIIVTIILTKPRNVRSHDTLLANNATAAYTEGTPILPTGFALNILVEGLVAPTDIAMLPSGDILVAEKGVGAEMGQANIYRVLSPLTNPTIQGILTLGTNPTADSGVLGLIADPDFAQNGYFYIWYPTQGSANPWDTNGTSKYRLSRFTLDETSGIASPNSELVLLDNMPRSHFHHGGGLGFDANGYLYLATGDTFNTNWDNHPSQDMQSLLGKVLRINPTETGYDIPPDNPFIDDPNALPEIFALGLRNPFKLTVATNGTIMVSDVGAETWEEVNLLQAGANYGWPFREGPCEPNTPLPCSPTPSTFTDPAIYHQHPPTIGSSVAGLAFYEGTAFPTPYQNQFFFTDYVQGFLAALSVPHGLYTSPHFGQNLPQIVDLEYYDDALYLLNLRQGTISQLYYSEDAVPPVAHITAVPLLGSAPLTVTFSAKQSISPQDLPLTYQWDWGDGSPIVTSTHPIISHTYQTDGNYTAQLIVTESGAQSSNPATMGITVYSGELPQIELTNTVITGSHSHYRGGDTFIYEAIRQSGTADLNPDTPYTWRIDLHHNQHIHPILVGHTTISDTFSVGRGDHGSIDLSYRFHLTMHTDTGQTVRVSHDLPPNYTAVTFVTSPTLSSVDISLNEQIVRPLPYAHTAIAGVEQRATMPIAGFADHQLYTFAHWADTLDPNRTRNFIVPDNNTQLTAVYQPTEPQRIWIPFFKVR